MPGTTTPNGWDPDGHDAWYYDAYWQRTNTWRFNPVSASLYVLSKAFESLCWFGGESIVVDGICVSGSAFIEYVNGSFAVTDFSETRRYVKSYPKYAVLLELWKGVEIRHTSPTAYTQRLYAPRPSADIELHFLRGESVSASGAWQY